MDPALHSDPHHQRQRARFDVLRRRIFGEMAAGAARWRLTWILPFHAFVVVLLIARAQSGWRAGTLVGVWAVTALLFVVQIMWPRTKFTPWSLFIAATSLLVAVAVTGGLASPLVITSLPMMFGVSITLSEPKWMKPVLFVYMFGGFLALALLSHTAVGRLDTPLTPDGPWPTPEFVTISMMSVGFVLVSAYKVGCTVAEAYQRVALELVERREELCTETEDRTRALEGIAARLAHEVKNPLAAIKGLSTHVARSATDPKVAERLSIVAAEADRLQGIVEGFLSFSRGLDELKVAPMMPHEIAREIALLLETRASDNGIVLDVTGVSDISVNADARKLRQALLNLVLNAMQASPPGKSVYIRVDRTAKGVCREGGVRISVIDEGPGMTPEVLERIRKPYFTTKEGGSGLGVAVARGLIEQHGGTLTYESSAGKGTTVAIDLPMCAMKFGMKNSLPNPVRAILRDEESADAAHPEVSAEAPAR